MDTNEFLELMGVPLKHLTFLWRIKNSQYRELKIPKRGGGFRTILDPSEQLREAQRPLLTNVLSRIELPDYLWAFELGRSIPTMARLHIGKRVIYSWDIKSYFDNITQKMVEESLPQEWDSKVRRLVSELSTYRFYLPQGALTSPKISNIITSRTFGGPLQTYFEGHGGTMTIYADDITVSFDEMKSAEFFLESDQIVREVLGNFSLRINERKTKLMKYSTRQYVCGVVVNEKTSIPREKKLLFRAIINNVSRNGFDHEAVKMGLTTTEFISHMNGNLNWFKQLNPEVGGRYERSWKELVNGSQ